MMSKFAVATTALLLATAARASDTPLYQPAPSWVLPSIAIDPAKLRDDSPILLVLDNQQRLVDGEVWSYVDTATRVASSEVLAQAGTLNMPWQPAKGDLIIHRVEIIRGAEHIDLLAAGRKFTVLRREEQLERSVLTGQLTATFAAEGLRIGDVLRVTISTRQKETALRGGLQAYAGLPALPFRIGDARVRMVWPANSDIHWKSYASGVVTKEATANGLHQLTVALPLPKQPDMPQDAPARFRNLQLLEASSFADWAAVSKVMAPLYATDGLISPGSPLSAEVARIKTASTDPATRAAAALRLVQEQVRYFLVGLDQGNYVPQAPTQTWSLRYGDCKAKTLLLLALLHALDIEAEPILASIQLGDRLPDRLPSAGAFDHVLVRATIAGEPLWLDGTDNGARLADLHDTPPFRWVLPVRAGGSALMPLPMHGPARPDLLIDVERDQAAGIPLPTPYKLSFTMRGRGAEMLRVAASQASRDQRNEIVTKLAAGYTDPGQITTSAITFDEASGTAVVTASGIADSGWQREENRYRLTLDQAVSKITFDPDRARAAWQAIPVATEAPISVVIRTRIHLPANGTGFALEGDQILPEALAGYRLQRSTRQADGWLTVEDRIVSTSAEIAPADIAATRSRVALAKTRLLRDTAPADVSVRWQLAEAVRPGTGFAAIRGAYKAAIDASPDEAYPYLNRAAFLEGVFDRRGAIADLDKAIAIAPGVDAYTRRAAQYSALDEKDKALADLLAAQKLDPGSPDIAQQLAMLRADRGEQDQALAVIQERIDAGGERKSEMMAVKADLLGRGGDKEAAIATADSAIAATPGKPNLLNSRCWLKATLNVALDTALKDCTRSIELVDSNNAALDSRAMVYYRLGRMDDALADLTAALDIDPNQAGSLFMRGVIREKTGQAQLARQDLAAARMIWPPVDREYRRFGVLP